MTKTEFNDLGPGDVVCYAISHAELFNRFTVTDNFGDRVTAVKTVDMTNPVEWELVNKKSTTLQEIKRLIAML